MPFLLYDTSPPTKRNLIERRQIPKRKSVIIALATGDDITERIGTDAIGKKYGKGIVAADENGRWVDYLILGPLHNSTMYRKRTSAIKADGPIFAAGS